MKTATAHSRRWQVHCATDGETTVGRNVDETKDHMPSDVQVFDVGV